jgi:hypothetical protein
MRNCTSIDIVIVSASGARYLWASVCYRVLAAEIAGRAQSEINDHVALVSSNGKSMTEGARVVVEEKKNGVSYP